MAPRYSTSAWLAAPALRPSARFAVLAAGVGVQCSSNSSPCWERSERIALKKPFRDGTVAVDLDLLSLLCRLVAVVPAPRFHTVRYFGVLAPAAKRRPLVVPTPGPSQAAEDATTPDSPSPCSPAPASTCGSRYRPWAELLKRTFALDVTTCPRCCERMRLMALITQPQSVQRFLLHRGEPTEPPVRAPPRDPPYFKTLIVRRRPTSERSQQGELFEEH